MAVFNGIRAGAGYPGVSLWPMHILNRFCEISDSSGSVGQEPLRAPGIPHAGGGAISAKYPDWRFGLRIGPLLFLRAADLRSLRASKCLPLQTPLVRSLRTFSPNRGDMEDNSLLLLNGIFKSFFSLRFAAAKIAIIDSSTGASESGQGFSPSQPPVFACSHPAFQTVLKNAF
jgi:hypothetical protein